MKVLFVIIVCFFMFSCKDKKTYYKYQGVTVTRIDEDGESIFFYGEIKDDTTGHPFIKAEYYGFNNGLDVLLHFKKDSSVEIISYGGGYLVPNSQNGKKLYIGKYTNDKTDWDVLLHYPNIIRISDVPDLERQYDSLYKSKVLTQRP